MIVSILLLTFFIFLSEVTLGFMQRSCIKPMTSFHPTRILTMEFDWKGLKKKTDESYKKTADALSSNFNSLRAGAANPAILDRVFVDAYGSMTPLNQVARIGTSGPQQLVIEPFDKSQAKDIEKAISVSNLNLTPNNDGGIIRINVSILSIIQSRKNKITN